MLIYAVSSVLQVSKLKGKSNIEGTKQIRIKINRLESNLFFLSQLFLSIFSINTLKKKFFFVNAAPCLSLIFLQQRPRTVCFSSGKKTVCFFFFSSQLHLEVFFPLYNIQPFTNKSCIIFYFFFLFCFVKKIHH